ncbi:MULTISPECIES: hypothetical protein [Dietzia]|jgi:hypothetical protein|uniref:hypothetical protein n=1 Tax=Dietzia TaxID=37914 RepID=UPI00223B439F|nr:hypothetical protein [Dietzia maris]MBB0990482.1 hypothetical protein [Dietzia sp. SLG510A3-30A2]MBB0995149.1 hypothetical protein [Dietzia sp. SLG510A3-40A3]MBB1009343.1 hypothetical protein [Dietzia sp. SLG510A3-3B2-2]MCT1432477.1 hypothetical protein [Dietzia maris]MCT1519638.1 hypothetical protein [Dietzia maris]
MTSPTPTTIPRSRVTVLAVTTGVLMAGYLLLRPYGDADGGATLGAAEAFSSPLWLVSHLAGAASLVALAALWSLLTTGPLRWAGPVGAALVLPYYGAETFALHEIGSRALEGDRDVLNLVSAVRDNPTAVTLFAVGLTALAVAGIVAALSWLRMHRPGRAAVAFLPLAVIAAMFLPQFFVPPAGRMAYGLAFAAAAVYAALSAASAARDTTGSSPARGRSVAEPSRVRQGEA